MSLVLELIGATAPPLFQNPDFDTAKGKESGRQINEK
jgi:hypothetical protein